MGSTDRDRRIDGNVDGHCADRVAKAVVLAVSIDSCFAHMNTECQFPWLAGAGQWHGCQSRLMWRRRPMQLYALRGVRTPAGSVTGVVVAAGLASCLALLRRELALPRPAAPRAAHPHRRARTPAP